MEQVTVGHSTWIAAPRERVFAAVSEPEQLAQWLLPPMLGATMKRDGSGTLLVCMGPMEVPLATMETVDAPRSVSMRSLPEQLLTTSYILEDENNGTRVAVNMSGFEALSAEARQERVEPTRNGWEKAMANLQAYVAGTELPFPEGYVAALFGHRREARNTYAVERSIWIAAPRERVWHAITEPAQIERWFSPGTPWASTGLEVGAKLFVPDPETGDEMYTQVIERVDPLQRFVIRSTPEPPETSQVTDHMLQEENGGTRLTINNSGYGLMPTDVRWNAMEQNAFGFGMMLENVRAYVEGNELPYPGGF